MRRMVFDTRFRTISLVALVASLVASTGITASAVQMSSASASPTSPSGPALGRSELARGFSGAASRAPRPLTNANCSVLFTVVPSADTALAQNELESASALSPTDMWAVGFSNSGVTNASDRTLAEHWNGSAWSVIGTPNVGAGFNALAGVSANNANDVWAVGVSQSGSVTNSLALHWNGSSWGIVSMPQSSATYQSLGGVSALASNNVYAAGTYRNNGSLLLQTLILHWDGSSWTVVPTLNAGAGDNVFETVFARAANDIWAVGYYRATTATSSPRLTLIEHWDGVSWTVHTSANPLVGGDNWLFNVSASSATEVWAVGVTVDLGTMKTQSLTEHLVGGTWTAVAAQTFGTGDNVLTGLVTLSPTNAWASGYGLMDTLPSTAGTTLVEHWNGTAWSIQTSDNPGTGGNGLFGLASLPGNTVWAVGGQVASGPVERTLTEQFQLPAPTNVTAIPGNNSATVSWTAPACDGGFPTTAVVITASDGCTLQNSIQTGATSPAILPSGFVTNGSPVTFTVQAVSTSLGAETASAPSLAVIPTGGAVVNAYTACSRQQYAYASPNAVNFVDMDVNNLKLVVNPSVDSFAIISGNADLWTANAGINQDIGINVSGGTFTTGQIVGWKESGGFAGTFSPNAAAVQAVVSLLASTAYTIKLQWKSNKAAPGATIFAGAGPLAGGGGLISPTRLTVHLVPVSATSVTTVSTNKQYGLSGSNGTTWTDLDAPLLSTTVTPSVPMTAVITANSDLWTASAGYNQDIAINVDSAIAAWKESGGFAGTFSPNAAFVQAFVPLAAAAHTIKLQWKTNKPAGGASIYAGAGPWPGGTTGFSPTRLTVLLLPAVDVNPTVSTQQYTLPSSDGAGWTPIDSTVLRQTFIPVGVTYYTYRFAGNVDLWTANAGFNQDVGIFISGGQYGPGTLVAWKESGGFAGTFSPNAAYVETVQRLNGGASYTFWLAWKTNKPAAGATIFAAAGPLPATTSFSPTSLTAFELSSP